ncbi:SMC_prok_A [Kluyveromyces marxianus DMKU3-1042]|uniref:SMC_prok_A n=1 Tax=Kluyveromyces marxianus (strain DMKU3-1042 / BCC 29191 / NBRC 104275) TaxID=1003335 RepID=W0T6I1_KLUMD|nr:uncharacterized protein KLMA_20557 [Kluyveromyces marxianus DMKU3-1042]BAO39015.1 SMC_prok_A [Kluyveromyces marxianus DMKU3-1042]
MTGGKNSVRIVPQPKIRNKDAVDEDLVGGGLYSMSDNDISEISITLKKLHDVNKSIRERVDAVDDQVRQTQMELENLVSRSSNNNKHLQSLLLSSQDVKELHQLLEKLSVQQQEQMDKNRDVESVLSRIIAEQSVELKESMQSGRIKELEQKIDELESKYGHLESLDARVIEKEKQLTELEVKLQHRQLKFEELRSRAKEMQSQLQEDLLTRYKAVQDSVTLSMTNFANTSSIPSNSTSRTASLLRNKYMNEKFNDKSRRVISLNEPRPVSAFESIPNNNSDFEE